MYEDLAAAENRVVGLKQLLRGLEADAVARVYIAEDAEEHLKERIRGAARGRGVTVETVPSMEELGEVCGIEVSAACAAILRK
jgi:large subunit ribosomal protein L7A